MGSGKTSTADKMADKYDLVIPTDFSRPKQPDGSYAKISRERKSRIREEKLAKILSADSDGKKVLVEGHPPGVVKLFQVIPGHDHLKDIDKVKVLDVSLVESFRRCLQRAVEDPDERDVMEEMDSAVDNNKKYDRYLKRITDAGVPVETIKTMTKEAAAKLVPGTKIQERLDKHLSPSDPQRWKGFSKDLRSRAFAESFKNDERATPAQRQSVDMRHRHITAKDKGITVKGETGTYQVKYHPTVDAYTCSCGDYTYKKSGVKGGVCKHIQQARDPKQEQSLLHLEKVGERIAQYELEKRAYLENVALAPGQISWGLRSLALARQRENARRSGMLAKEVADQYAQNMPQPKGQLHHFFRDIYHESVPGFSYQ
jgi:hypothetical protein